MRFGVQLIYECSTLQDCCQYVFQRGVTCLHSHQRCARVVFTESLATADVASLVARKLNLTVILLCIALGTNKFGQYFIFLITVFPLVRSFRSNPGHI